MHTELLGHFRDRLPGLRHDPYRPLAELRVVDAFPGSHDPQLSLRSRSPRYEGRLITLAHLLGFDLMPRIRNWKGLTFYRPSKTTEYVHIDALFGEAGKNVIDWALIESQFRHLMRVAVSVREGVISSATLLKRLRSGSHKNATYTAFREVGRVIRTVQLLRYLTDAPLRRRVTAATNKVESFNRFSQWVGFGNRGVIADNDPVEQEKAMKFNALLTNAVIFHNALVVLR
ncbi:Tn3 family transposase [Streptomyces sp. NPDC059467]|uniref:Tn3 family transposase n=1 Tax=Streptomyces sp. NPDC059467 TaxID=3346844 RepID=UPI003695E68C